LNVSNVAEGCLVIFNCSNGLEFHKKNKKGVINEWIVAMRTIMLGGRKNQAQQW
jgi:hypothetical protein